MSSSSHQLKLQQRKQLKQQQLKQQQQPHSQQNQMQLVLTNNKLVFQQSVAAHTTLLDRGHNVCHLRLETARRHAAGCCALLCCVLRKGSLVCWSAEAICCSLSQSAFSADFLPNLPLFCRAWKDKLGRWSAEG